jgi:hypothetical protein
MFAIIVQAHCSKMAGCQHYVPKSKAGGDVLLARRLPPTLVPHIQRVSPVFTVPSQRSTMDMHNLTFDFVARVCD